MWYAKMYFSGEKEFFENDAFGMQGVPSKQLELPFLESLLTFLELDEKEITPMLERISVNWLPKRLGQSAASGNYFGSKGVCKAVFRDKEAGREVF